MEVTDEKLAEYKELFSQYDNTGDGKISIKDLAVILEKIEIETGTQFRTSGPVAEFLVTQEPGKVEFSEFLKLVNRKPEYIDEGISKAFQSFDRDGDGFLDAKDLLKIMTELGEKLTTKDLEEMIQEADLDGDGKISFKEFRRMMSLS